MPPRRRGANKAKAKSQLSLGDLVLAKVKGFPFWPAKVCLRFLCPFYGFPFWLSPMMMCIDEVVFARASDCMVYKFF